MTRSNANGAIGLGLLIAGMGWLGFQLPLSDLSQIPIIQVVQSPIVQNPIVPVNSMTIPQLLSLCQTGVGTFAQFFVTQIQQACSNLQGLATLSRAFEIGGLIIAGIGVVRLLAERPSSES